MQKYTIEGNKNFYDELFKSLDNDTEDDENICQITGFPLDAKSVTLECNHKFNYEPLYKEICRQKFDFKTYDYTMLSRQDQIKINNFNLDYFIKCPYCRNIQFSVLPYYEELGLKKIYGVNSLDPALPDKPEKILHPNIQGTYYGSDNYTFYSYGKLFKKGQCCFAIKTTNSTLCSLKYVTSIGSTNKLFCKLHYKAGVKLIKSEEKQKKVEEKQKKIEEKKHKKVEEKEHKKTALEEINVKRFEKGLLPLKRLPVVKKKIENVVQQTQQIGQYVPELEEEVTTEVTTEVNNILNGCKAKLKSGVNKGSECGCKKINDDGLCNRHRFQNNL